MPQKLKRKNSIIFNGLRIFLGRAENYSRDSMRTVRIEIKPKDIHIIHRQLIPILCLFCLLTIFFISLLACRDLFEELFKWFQFRHEQP